MSNNQAKTGHQSISQAEPRPLPLDRAPEGFYPGSVCGYSASSTQAVLPWKQQRQALKTLKQVQGDGTLFNNNAAFTLIELLVVVLIIGILAAVAVPQYQKAVEKARATEIITNVNTISKTAEMYFLSGNTEAIGLQDLEIPLSGCVYDEDGNCYTKHATYSFSCDVGMSNRCYLETARVDGCIASNGVLDGSKCDYSNMWTISRVWTNGQMTANDCVTQLTDTGRSICKSLESQGYTFSDSEL